MKKLNEKKLKRNSNIGDRLDLVPVLIMVISLFGIGIFWAIFRSGITLAGFGVFFFGIMFAVAFVLYCVGEINRRSAEKAAFCYMNEIVCARINEICEGGEFTIRLNLGIGNDGIVFTLTNGSTEAVCDLSSAKRMPLAATLFIDICLGAAAFNIKNNSDKAIYRNVSYEIVINNDEPITNNFVEDGKPNETELDRVIQIYQKRCKKYQGKR